MTIDDFLTRVESQPVVNEQRRNSQVPASCPEATPSPGYLVLTNQDGLSKLAETLKALMPEPAQE